MNEHHYQKTDSHIFAFCPMFSYDEVLRILTSKRLETGEDGIPLLTPIKRWLAYEPIEETEIASLSDANKDILIKQKRILEAGWGIGFKITKLTELTDKWRWGNNGQFEFVKFCLPPNLCIDISTDDWKNNVVILFPSESARKNLWPLEMYKSSEKSRSYPKWPWMYVTKEYISRYVKNDRDLEKYLYSKFLKRNMVSDSIIRPEGPGLW